MIMIGWLLSWVASIYLLAINTVQLMIRKMFWLGFILHLRQIENLIIVNKKHCYFNHLDNSHSLLLLVTSSASWIPRELDQTAGGTGTTTASSTCCVIVFI